MKWIRKNWQWATFNLFALAVMANFLWSMAAQMRLYGIYWEVNDTFILSGKMAIRFLLCSLAMTPLNTLFGWNGALKLRKSAGLWAFTFATIHFSLYVIDLRGLWLQYPLPDYIAALGLVSLCILTLMAATSTRWAMKRLGKWWKRLHQLVYIAGLLVTTHAVLELPSKRAMRADPHMTTEVVAYLVIVLMLLAVRIPPIRTRLANLRFRRGLRRELAG